MLNHMYQSAISYEVANKNCGCLHGLHLVYSIIVDFQWNFSLYKSHIMSNYYFVCLRVYTYIDSRFLFDPPMPMIVACLCICIDYLSTKIL
jgi:hypothetical protein